MSENKDSQSDTNEPVSNPSTPASPSQSIQLDGWRRVLVLTSVFIGLFLAFLDTTIVSVALATIANEFEDFDHATWVLTSYLLTYMAFAIIITRLSDIFGRKAIEVASFVLFIAFSLGCALSQSMTQLIIFRAFQGIGGSGLFSMTMVIVMTSVPPRKRGMLSGVIGLVMVTSGVLGPVLSGAITHNHNSSTWRWIFWLNMPVGGIALAIYLVAWPSGRSQTSFTRNSVASVDFLGCILLLAASVLLVFALQEGGAYIYAWSSATIIATLTISAVAFIGFIGWQEWLALHPDLAVKLIFPIKIAGQRVLGSAMLYVHPSSTIRDTLAKSFQRSCVIGLRVLHLASPITTTLSDSRRGQPCDRRGQAAAHDGLLSCWLADIRCHKFEAKFDAVRSHRWFCFPSTRVRFDGYSWRCSSNA